MWKQPKCALIEKCYTHTVEYYAVLKRKASMSYVTWMNLGDITLNKQSPKKKKGKYSMIA